MACQAACLRLFRQDGLRAFGEFTATDRLSPIRVSQDYILILALLRQLGLICSGSGSQFPHGNTTSWLQKLQSGVLARDQVIGGFSASGEAVLVIAGVMLIPETVQGKMRRG